MSNELERERNDNRKNLEKSFNFMELWGWHLNVPACMRACVRPLMHVRQLVNSIANHFPFCK